MGPIDQRESNMALIFPQDQFQHILRILNTNVDGRHKVPFAMTSIKGVGRRFAHMVCKKAEVDLQKRAGELTSEEIDKIVVVVTVGVSVFVARKLAPLVATVRLSVSPVRRGSKHSAPLLGFCSCLCTSGNKFDGDQKK